MTTNFTTNTSQPVGGVRNHTTGVAVTSTGGATATSFTCGFVPRVVRWQNVTDRIMHEWYYGMASPSATKTIANGTHSLETTDGITVGTDGTFTVAAAIIIASKSHVWEAFG
jgi:hypothetical protein